MPATQVAGIVIMGFVGGNSGDQTAPNRRVVEYLERLDAAGAEEGETAIDAGAVCEALEVL